MAVNDPARNAYLTRGLLASEAMHCFCSLDFSDELQVKVAIRSKIRASFAPQFSALYRALCSRDAQNFCGSEIHFESARKMRPHECGTRCIQEYRFDLWSEVDRDKDR
ncbi:MAG: hypothetical protein ABJB10_11485 [Mesorhizobium sp.]